MNTKKILLIIVPAITLAFGATFFIEQGPIPVPAESEVASSAEATQSQAVTLIVGDARYEAILHGSATVAELMEQIGSESDLTYRTKEFPGLGAFVDEINGKRSMDGLYWILHINGTKSELGISQAVAAPGDTVEWRYEKSY